jgi:Uma2 family endonuclease
MSSPSGSPAKPRVWDDPRIVAPDEDTWRALSLEERDEVVQRILAVFDEYREAMSEGTRHSRPKNQTTLDLDEYFRRSGRSAFVASELGVMYPARPVIVPDVLVVMDCDPDLEMDSWVVADRGRGIDVVLEFRNLGRKHKDLRENVREYAGLRIPEYFSLDVRARVLRGWRLGAPKARTYQPIMPQDGRLFSNALGLELAPEGTRLRFFAEGSLIPTTAELAARLQAVSDQQQQRMAALERERDEARQQRDEAWRLRGDALDRIARTQTTLIQRVLRECERRGVELSDEQHSTVVVETDVDVLLRWLERAGEVTTGDALLEEP